MSAAQADPPPKPPKPASETLPPVEAPTGTFVLQLFLIPLLIVSIVVVLWLSFSWLAQMGRDDPDTLVKSIERGDNASWQRAYELADLLRSPDPRYDALRSDAKLAGIVSPATFRSAPVALTMRGGPAATAWSVSRTRCPEPRSPSTSPGREKSTRTCPGLNVGTKLRARPSMVRKAPA